MSKDKLHRPGLGAVTSFLTLVAFVLGAAPAFGSTVSSAVFSGGSGTVTNGGSLYAKSGASLTLSVTTSSDTKCVAVTGAFTARQTSGTGKFSWTFPFTAPSNAPDGVQTVTAAASSNFNSNNCTGQ